MPCYCTKISKIKSDIIKITNAKSALVILKSGNGDLDSRLNELVAGMQAMATPDNMDACVSAIKNLNKDSGATIDAMINQCTSKINTLKSDQTKYEKEDKTYHQK